MPATILQNITYFRKTLHITAKQHKISLYLGCVSLFCFRKPRPFFLVAQIVTTRLATLLLESAPGEVGRRWPWPPAMVVWRDHHNVVEMFFARPHATRCCQGLSPGEGLRGCQRFLKVEDRGVPPTPADDLPPRPIKKVWWVSPKGGFTSCSVRSGELEKCGTQIADLQLVRSERMFLCAATTTGKEIV